MVLASGATRIRGQHVQSTLILGTDPESFCSQVRCFDMTQTVDGYSVVAFLPFVVLAPALALPLSRRFGHSWWLLVFSIASVGAIVSVTVTGRMLKLTSWGRGDIVFSWLYDANSWSQALSLDRTWILNALLFAPAGCFCTLAFRRPWITLVSLSVFAFVIEMVQRSTRLGVADVSDLVAGRSWRTDKPGR